jgi:DNA-directed RNA polymerase subunit M/transcription elongation factor TFIIS
VTAVQEEKKKDYLVLECPACSRYLLAYSNNKTRTCPYCGKKVKIDTTRLVSRSYNAEDARLALQKLKMKEQEGKSSASEILR